jgi:hypothetical protein
MITHLKKKIYIKNKFIKIRQFFQLKTQLWRITTIRFMPK